MHRIINADVYAGLKSIEDGSIDIAVTSPPYWGQRDYEFEGQIGIEGSFTEYIEKLVSIFNVLQKKLKSRGVFYLNIGDKYLSKYGNSSLGLIPYKLAYQMTRFGWHLCDIIIWYKPNHMPSSISNRFSTTYEPIFVFGREEKNYYRIQKDKIKFSNVLKINTQPTPYEHVAVYPEKLVESLIELTNCKEGLVVDPFSGSGTTLKSVQNLNNSINNYNLYSIMIEANELFVNMIKNRCGLNTGTITKLKQENYSHVNIVLQEDLNFETQIKNSNNKLSSSDTIKIFEDEAKYLSYLSLIASPGFKNKISDESVLYLGIKNNDLNLIYETSKIINYGWIIRNIIVVQEKKTWFPVFFIVKDSKRVKYHFNLDAVRVQHKTKNNQNYYVNDFMGLAAVDTFSSEKRNKGIVIQIEERYSDGFPKFIFIKWADGKVTREFILHDEDLSEHIKFYCPICGDQLKRPHKNSTLVCLNCKSPLWKDLSTIPILKESFPYEVTKEIKYLYSKPSELKLFEKNYNGKFKMALKINMGASPGARSSTQSEYFSKQRVYDIYQPMISDYLNIKRISKNISKQEMTILFPKSYKHTVGHWLRKDMGGSLPQIYDWNKLSYILDLDESYTNYVCRTALKFQTVKASYKGKNPGDFFDSNVQIEKILRKTLIK